MKAITLIAALALLLLACKEQGHSPTPLPVNRKAHDLTIGTPTGSPSLHDPSTRNRVGFFNPTDTVPALTSRFAFGMINSYSVDQVEQSLNAANGTNYKVRIDFSELLLQQADPAAIRTQYVDSSGETRTKHFAPLPQQKIKQFPTNPEIAKLIKPYIQVIQKYPSNVGVLFIADEPYLNGISKDEMERAASTIRNELNTAGLQKIKLGVIFASGMFDAEFAQHLDRASGDYVKSIDDYYERGLAIQSGTHVDPNFDINGFAKWVEIINKYRLTTYDAAGNMYTGGGIPHGFDVIAFDFYISTLLLDRVHENSLAWLSSHSPNFCAEFNEKRVSSIRTSLSFFRDSPIKDDEYSVAKDREILDKLFHCRMTAIHELMRKAAKGTALKFMMISESSSNGVLEFHSDGRPKTDQPKPLVEARVLEEVSRGVDFYKNHQSDFSCGLMFFIYEDAHDTGIRLDIHGAVSLPSVMNHLYNFASDRASFAQSECD